MSFVYQEKALKHLNQVVRQSEAQIKKASLWIADTLEQDRLIHTFGTGHSNMIALELFVRAGGLANVNAMLDSLGMTAEGARRSADIERVEGLAQIIWNQHQIEKGDVMIIISNSGRNAIPIEMALIAKKANIPVLAITSMEQTQKYPSRHSSGLKLYEIADLVVDNGVPSGDGLMNIDGNLVGAISSLAGIFTVNLIATEGMKIAAERGIKLPVYYSQNIDGYSNESLYQKYEGRIKHL
ncbi:MAG: sugar isomerase domain-containing protein [Saprospiraceae bacterium]|jgi:uncharacterized phosphosugar-binding protein